MTPVIVEVQLNGLSVITVLKWGSGRASVLFSGRSGNKGYSMHPWRGAGQFLGQLFFFVFAFMHSYLNINLLHAPLLMY